MISNHIRLILLNTSFAQQHVIFDAESHAVRNSEFKSHSFRVNTNFANVFSFPQLEQRSCGL